MSTELAPEPIGRLSLQVLTKIMSRLHELQENLGSIVRTDDLADLIPQSIRLPASTRSEVTRRNIYIDRHLQFLEQRGLVVLGQPTYDLVRTVEFSVDGWVFVQPELADFGRAPILPEVVKALEDKIQTLTYPPEEKAGMLFNLREAIAKQAPDIIAKVIVEISAKLLSSRG
jgi:hypothetical protein